MRLLPIRPDHVGGSVAGGRASPGRFRYRRRNGGQYLPLRHLRAHPRGDQACCKRTADLGDYAMSLIENSLIGRHSIEDLTQTLSRRGLLKAGLAAGFTLAFRLPLRASDEMDQSADNEGKFAPNAFIRIDQSGQTTLVMPQVEMGQGVYTALPMILAEELDADFSQVTLEHAPPSDKLYGNPLFGIQATGNSNSVRAWWKPLRTAGANTRAMLNQAAARQWQ